MKRPEPWHVYMLRCGDGSLYTGATNDLDRRMAKHQSGRGARYTRSRLPVILVFSEPAADRSAALKREAALKRLPRAMKLTLVGAKRRRVPKRAPRAPTQRTAEGAKASAERRRRAGAKRVRTGGDVSSGAAPSPRDAPSGRTQRKTRVGTRRRAPISGR